MSRNCYQARSSILFTRDGLGVMCVAFPKPKDVPYVAECVRVLRDGREICNLETIGGRLEYGRRLNEMLIRQGGRCCLEAYAPMCPGPLRREDCTFEHERPRSAGRRDDRISLPDGTWINGAAHLLCNQWKGSRYIDYNRSFQRGQTA